MRKFLEKMNMAGEQIEELIQLENLKMEWSAGLVRKKMAANAIIEYFGLKHTSAPIVGKVMKALGHKQIRLHGRNRYIVYVPEIDELVVCPACGAERRKVIEY